MSNIENNSKALLYFTKKVVIRLHTLASALVSLSEFLSPFAALVFIMGKRRLVEYWMDLLTLEEDLIEGARLARDGDGGGDGDGDGHNDGDPGDNNDADKTDDPDDDSDDDANGSNRACQDNNKDATDNSVRSGVGDSLDNGEVNGHADELPPGVPGGLPVMVTTYSSLERDRTIWQLKKKQAETLRRLELALPAMLPASELILPAMPAPCQHLASVLPASEL